MAIKQSCRESSYSQKTRGDTVNWDEINVKNFKSLDEITAERQKTSPSRTQKPEDVQKFTLRVISIIFIFI